MLGLSHFVGHKHNWDKLGWKSFIGLSALHRTEMLWGDLFYKGQMLVSMIRVYKQSE